MNQINDKQKNETVGTGVSVGIPACSNTLPVVFSAGWSDNSNSLVVKDKRYTLYVTIVNYYKSKGSLSLYQIESFVKSIKFLTYSEQASMLGHSCYNLLKDAGIWNIKKNPELKDGIILLLTSDYNSTTFVVINTEGEILDTHTIAKNKNTEQGFNLTHDLMEKKRVSQTIASKYANSIKLIIITGNIHTMLMNNRVRNIDVYSDNGPLPKDFQSIKSVAENFNIGFLTNQFCFKKTKTLVFNNVIISDRLGSTIRNINWTQELGNELFVKIGEKNITIVNGLNNQDYYRDTLSISDKIEYTIPKVIKCLDYYS